MCVKTHRNYCSVFAAPDQLAINPVDGRISRYLLTTWKGGKVGRTRVLEIRQMSQGGAQSDRASACANITDLGLLDLDGPGTRGNH
jgi:hypothetical protein